MTICPKTLAKESNAPSLADYIRTKWFDLDETERYIVKHLKREIV